MSTFNNRNNLTSLAQTHQEKTSNIVKIQNYCGIDMKITHTE